VEGIELGTNVTSIPTAPLGEALGWFDGLLVRESCISAVGLILGSDEIVYDGCATGGMRGFTFVTVDGLLDVESVGVALGLVLDDEGSEADGPATGEL
jgi:hypothetical protein